MQKNNVVIINPKSINVMKAVCNAVMLDIVDIVIFGNKDIIKSLCEELNFNSNLLNIIECNNEKEILSKFDNYKNNFIIDGVILDDIKNIKIKSCLRSKTICHVVDFGVFKNSVYLIDRFNKIKIVGEMLHELNIYDIKVGVVYNDPNCKNEILTGNIRFIDMDEIMSCEYKIILFESQELKEQFINKVEQLTLPRVAEIKKASNMYVFDAFGKQFKNIFFELVFISKLTTLNSKINAKTS